MCRFLHEFTRSCLFSAVAFAACASAGAEDWYATPAGKADGQGTKASPWDLASALSGQKKIAAGDTLWLLAGIYKHPDRSLNGPGYTVRLVGSEGKPIHIRGETGKRVTIDGGLRIQQPSTYLWIRDLEIIVSENLSMSRTVNEPGSHPKSYNRPWGGLNIHAGKGCKYINLVIHDNAQGISFWSAATDSEVHGCLIYDNGWKAPDRGHGHAIYSQNKDGVKVISDCIMTGGYGYTMHAYGSSRAYVDNYLVTGNICYDGGRFLIGGGRPSRNIRVLKNYLFNVGMQIGYSAPHNEDCEVRDNVIVGGGLHIRNYKKAVNEGNLVLAKGDPRPEGSVARFEMRPNRYDRQRLHVAIFNWAKKPNVELLPLPLLEPGDRYRLMNPRDFFGKPVVAGTFQDTPIRVPVKGEFAAFVLLKESQ